MDILIKAEEILSVTKYKSGKACLWVGGFQKAVEIPEHGDLIPYTPTKNAIIKVVGKDNPLWSDIMDEVDKIPVVFERTT